MPTEPGPPKSGKQGAYFVWMPNGESRVATYISVSVNGPYWWTYEKQWQPESCIPRHDYPLVPGDHIRDARREGFVAGWTECLIACDHGDIEEEMKADRNTAMDLWEEQRDAGK